MLLELDRHFVYMHFPRHKGTSKPSSTFVAVLLEVHFEISI